MARSKSLKGSSKNPPASQKRLSGAAFASRRLYVFIAWDAASVLIATILAVLFQSRSNSAGAADQFWANNLILSGDSSVYVLFFVVLGFLACLLLFSWGMRLYRPERLQGHLHEQRLTLQVGIFSGLFVMGAVYLIDDPGVPRDLVLETVAASMLLLSVRRLVHRAITRPDAWSKLRNVLIAGTGAEAQSLRYQIERWPDLGYRFAGYLQTSSEVIEDPQPGAHEVAGTLSALDEVVKAYSVDEIFLTAIHEPQELRGLLQQAQKSGVDVRVNPDLLEDSDSHRRGRYLSQYAMFPMQRGRMNDLSWEMKRALDLSFSIVVLAALAVPLLVIALLIKIDSRGPVFYRSERVGRKGRVFKCTKFRTMFEGVHTESESDLTAVGKFLRKYSLHEIPQLFDVVRGDMSLVGPRPPLAGDMGAYHVSHLRRLDVTPGLTGLWQVQPSRTGNYVSLDLAYMENWSIWLDMKILIQTIVACCFAPGEGSSAASDHHRG